MSKSFWGYSKSYSEIDVTTASFSINGGNRKLPRASRAMFLSFQSLPTMPLEAGDKLAMVLVLGLSCILHTDKTHNRKENTKHDELRSC